MRRARADVLLCPASSISIRLLVPRGTLVRRRAEPAHLGALRGLHAAVAQVSSPCQTTRAASAPVIRRRRPDGRHAQRRVADAAPLLGYCGFVGGDGG